jgi:hypothetical protein
MIRTFDINVLVAKVIAESLIFFANFFVQNTFVFVENKNLETR